MRTRNQANIEQNPEINSLVRPSPFRKAVAWITLVAYVGQPLLVTAEIIADQAAAANKRPTVDVTANGLPLVQIATPNAAGLSHNQYTQFNVGPEGAILNNSNAAVQTQQAGFVGANPNLNCAPARIILNEVTSTNRSQLNGYTEVAGQQAEVIIANPNGITCNGCGFINTSRGVLTTGTPVISGGSLDYFRVTGGDIQIGSAGLNGSNLNQLDLIARSVQVNGEIWANNLNVITGTNEVDYNNLGVQVFAGDANKPTVGIDVALLGGMYANKIRLIGTEAGVGVNSLGNLSAQAGDFALDNAGQITLGGSTTASGNLTINSNTSITNNGTMYSQLDATLASTGGITNTGILSAGRNLALNADSLNSTGSLGAGIDLYGSAAQIGNLNITTRNQTVATGTNIAGGNISIAATDINLANSRTIAYGDIALNATAGNIDNTSGQIGSGRDLNIVANTIIGSGQAIAGRDANFNLQGNYTHADGSVFKANRNLTFSTTGNFVNQATLEALGNLTLTASNLDNQAAASINSANTALNINAGNITNAGRIEGNTIASNSNTFSNTGTVIGDNITLRANTLTNDNADAIIAATESVSLIIQNTLNNLDGATIYSLGDIAIGANLALDANGYLVGNTTNVTNSSAIIEADGNLRIGATTLTNKRTAVGLMWGPEDVGNPINSGGLHYTPSYSNQQFTAATTPAGKIMTGGNMWLGGVTIANNYSMITAGQALSANTVIANSGSPFLQRTSVTNGTQDNWVYEYVGWHWGVTCSWGICRPVQVDDYDWRNHPIAYAPLPTTAPIVGSVNVISEQNTPISGLPPVTQTQSAIDNAVIPATTVTVPSSGLYTLHPQPGQNYLVATDPRFTSYQNFVSSDYMLSRMSLDPLVVQKRLGDGFYEQKLILDQITELTGRRFLGENTSANEQYTALLDAGVDAAQELNLVPGVALTAAQVDALTSNIVWLVDQVAKLPDGTTQHVLAPKVYLTRLQEADLKPSGALIAANVIDIRSGGALQNSGTIAARSRLSIQAQDILNQGGTLGGSGDTNLSANNDILNQSGNINGRRIALTAGRDVISERLIDTSVLSGIDLPQPKQGGFGGFAKVAMSAAQQTSTSSTAIHAIAGINATESLDISAGRDVTIAGSNINASGDATINAGRDLTVRTVTTQLNASNGYGSLSHTEQLTSSITTGGNLTLASVNDMHLTSVKLDVGKDASLTAGGDLTLDASKNVRSSTGTTSAYTARSYDETVLGTTLNAGGNVTLTATNANAERIISSDGETGSDYAEPGTTTGRADGKGNIKLANATINSKGTLAVIADGNVEITTVDEKHESYQQTVTKSQGFASSTTTTKTKESSSSTAKGSSLTGTNVLVQAGDQTTQTGDITIKGSNIAATETVSIDAGRDLQILSAEDSASSSSSEVKKTQGMTMGSSGPELGKKTSNTVTDGSTTQVSSNITGNTVVTQSGNDTRISASNVKSKENTTLYAGSNLYIESVANTIRHNQETTESKIGMNVAMMDGRLHDISVGTNGKITEDGNTSSTQVGSQIGSEGSVNLLAGNSMMISASKLKAGKDMNLNAGGDIVLTGQYNQTATENSTAISMSSMKSKDKTTDQTQNYTFVGSSLDAGDNLNITAGNNIEFTAANLSSGADTNLTAEEGQVRFLTQKNINIVSQTIDDEDLVYEVHKGKGSQNETLVYTKIKTGGTLNVDAAKGVVVEVDEVPAVPVAEETTDENGQVIPATPALTTDPNITPHPTFSASTAALAKQPGMEWMGQMLKRDDVDWKKVAAAHDSWDYKNQNLTEAGAIILVVVVTVFTAGTASSAAAGASTAAGGGATGAVVGAAAGAAVTSLATTAALSFANNGGDLGKTLNDLGKRENIRGLLTAMVTAGVLKGVGGTQLVNNISQTTNLPTLLVNNTINGALTATVNTAINGGSLEDQLGNALLMAIINTAGAELANELHTDDKSLTANINNKLGHALLGCGMEVAQKKDCLSGAVGGVAGEMAGELLAPNGSQGLTDAQKDKIINLSKLIAGGVAMAAGLDVNAAMNTAGNAVANNRLMTPKEKSLIEEMAKLADGNPDKESRLSDAACALIHCSAQFPEGSQERRYYEGVEARGQGNTYELQQLTELQKTDPSLFSYGWVDTGVDAGKKVGNTTLRAAGKFGDFGEGFAIGAGNAVVQTGAMIVDGAQVLSAGSEEYAFAGNTDQALENITPVSDLGKAIERDGVIETVINAPGNAARGFSDTMRAMGQGNLEPFGELAGGVAVPVATGSLVGRLGGAGDVGGVPINGAPRSVSLGFESVIQQTQAMQELRGALNASGITDATLGVRGSSVTGFSYRTGAPFNPASDIDAFIESAQLTNGLRTSNSIPGFVHPNTIMQNYPLLDQWSSNWTQTLGRDITPGAFTTGNIPNHPAIIIK